MTEPWTDISPYLLQAAVTEPDNIALGIPRASTETMAKDTRETILELLDTLKKELQAGRESAAKYLAAIAVVLALVYIGDAITALRKKSE